MRRLPLTGICLAISIAPPIAAQNYKEIVTYSTLIGTPVGGLAPVLSNAMLDQLNASPEFSARVGHLSNSVTSGVTNYAASLGIPVGAKATVGVTAGFLDPACSGCKGNFLGGANAEARVTSAVLGAGADAALLTFGVNGALGFAKTRPDGFTEVSLAAGVPVAFVAGSSTFKIAPFVTPSLAWGRINSVPVAIVTRGGVNIPVTGSVSGTRFMLGGGLAVHSTNSPIGADVGFQKIFVQGGRALFGLDLTFALR